MIENMRKLKDRQNQQWALIDGGKGDGLAVFLHGFRGNYLTTWHKLPQILEQSSIQEEPFSNWDFLFLGYSTWHVESYLDIAQLIETNWSKASKGTPPFTKKYKRLALFGHSLGTLGIRQFLVNVPCPKNFVHSVSLFGTPLMGSPLAPLGPIGAVADAIKQKDPLILAGVLKGFPISDALRVGNPQLRMLRSWTKKLCSLDPWPQVNVVLGQRDLVVMHNPHDFVSYDGDMQHNVINHSHLDMMKIDRDTAIFDEILTALNGSN